MALVASFCIIAGMIREVKEQNYVVQLDLDKQVLALDAPDALEFEEPELSPFPQSSLRLISASLLAQKAKHFDDGLYASVELAAQSGRASFPSKASFLGRWSEALLRSGVPGEAARVVLAACQLGGVEKPPLAPDTESLVQESIERFLADEERSKPLGFYTSSEALAAIFRQDRMLMSELTPASWQPLREALLRESELLDAYKRILALGAGLTNPPDKDTSHLLQEGPAETKHVIAPSRSHEADLVTRLYGDKPIPDGFDLAEELARQVGAGSISLAPRDDSGWYDYQTWALEPLAAPDRTPEISRLKLTANYRRHLRDLFKGLLGLTRETHVKLLKPVHVGAAGGFLGPRRPVISIKPDLSVEPLATFYSRRAISYGFVARVLEDNFGPGWKDIPLTRPEPSGQSLGKALEAMEALFYGAHLAVCKELGMELERSLFPDRNAERDEASFRAWSGTAARDPDLSRDSRMMVPVFYDRGRGKIKVWVLLGWSVSPLTVGFERPPRVIELKREGDGPGGLRGWFTPGPKVRFESQFDWVAFPVTAEIYVDRLLDRDEFRRLCDAERTKSKILTALRAAA